VQNGILRAMDVGFGSWWLTPDCIAFAILSSEPPLESYRRAHHSGAGQLGIPPDHNRWNFDVGIVVKKDAVIRRYPDQLRAVGEFFHDKPKMAKRLYSFNEEGTAVFGIPIAVDAGKTIPWGDEARLYEEKINNQRGNAPRITPDLWAGICIYEDCWPTLKKWHKEAKRSVSVPIFTPQGKLLSIGF